MPTINSSVILIGVPDSQLELAFSQFSAAPQATSQFSHVSTKVVVMALNLVSQDFIANFQKAKAVNPYLQLILHAPVGQNPDQLLSAATQLEVFRISDGHQLQTDILLALERSSEVQQQLQLEDLVADQKSKLEKLYQILEEKVDKRQRILLDSKKKTFLAHSRWESLRQVMVGAHQSKSTHEMEQQICRTLSPAFDIQSLRIVFHPHDETFSQQLSTHEDLNVQSIALFHGIEKKGTLFFFRNSQKSFAKEENDFLQKVAEGVALAVDRLQKLEQTAQLKDQWQATFNAVSDPVALINEKYEIIQANSAFTERAEKFPSPIANRCYEVLFHRESPCVGCHRGENFRYDLNKGKLNYEVYSQSLSIEGMDGALYFNQYHDITEQLKIERKIIESARLAELGTIGSSIAHELNNPLGGILSFVQLMKMDLKSTDGIFPDIEEMEKGVRRCQEIIQNLLAFVRDPQADDESVLDLSEALRRALKLIEIQSRSRGIEIKVSVTTQQFPFKGHMSLLTQAIRNILQVSIESLIEASQQTKGFHPILEIRLQQLGPEYQMTVLDNGLEREAAATLGLSVSRQIIHDYLGSLELGAAAKPLRSAKMTLPAPAN